MGRKNWNKQTKELILRRDEHHCVYCGVGTNGIDHVIPIAEGGVHSRANGVCCCPTCNYKKGKKLDEQWIIKGLQRLIQHGEDVNWVRGIRYEEVEPVERVEVEEKFDVRQYAMNMLRKGGLSSTEIRELFRC